MRRLSAFAQYLDGNSADSAKWIPYPFHQIRRRNTSQKILNLLLLRLRYAIVDSPLRYRCAFVTPSLTLRYVIVAPLLPHRCVSVTPPLRLCYLSVTSPLRFRYATVTPKQEKMEKATCRTNHA